MVTLEVTSESAQTKTRISMNAHPDNCPRCLRGIDPRFRFGYIFNNHRADLIYQCPRQDCRELFIAYYLTDRDRAGNTSKLYRLRGLAPQIHHDREFGEHITSTSSDFARIFNQAHQAEELGMSDIAGPGYRKALEFLIKDYAILNNPKVSDDIKKKLLSQVINEYAADANIKSTAKRAAWLGNDETHYYRKWEDKDIQDLKILIELTVRWIESELLTRKYEESMND
jgi:hypothetical protein